MVNVREKDDFLLSRAMLKQAMFHENNSYERLSSPLVEILYAICRFSTTCAKSLVPIESYLLLVASIIISINGIFTVQVAFAASNYDFQLRDLGINGLDAYGSFTVDGVSVVNISGRAFVANESFIIPVQSNAGSFSSSGIISLTGYGYDASGSNVTFSISGPLSPARMTYEGLAQTSANYQGSVYDSVGFLTVFESSSGGDGGNSGGAPSPEVNASIGILLAVATFVFLRRKRNGWYEAPHS